MVSPILPSGELTTKVLEEYREINTNFRALADIRFKLLALVPTVSVVSLVLADDKVAPTSAKAALLGGIGLVTMIGVITYDQRNSQFYDSLIRRAKFLEAQLELPEQGEGKKPTDRSVGNAGGQFLNRPGKREARRLFGLMPMWHDLALAFIYGAAVGAWIFPLARWIALQRDGTGPERAEHRAALAAVTGAVVVCVELIWLDLASRRSKKPDSTDDQKRSYVWLAWKWLTRKQRFDFPAFKLAFEAKDTSTWLAFFAPDAEWWVHRPDAPLRSPNKTGGIENIRTKLVKVAGDDMKQAISDEVLGKKRVAFAFTVTLPDKSRYFGHTILHLADGKIARQVDVEAGD